VAAGLGSTPASPPAIAPEARLDAAWTPAGNNWRVRLSAGGRGEQAIDVPPGEARWQRSFLSVAVDRVLARFGADANWKLIAGAGPIVGWVRLRGVGFQIDHRDALVDAGAEAAVRLERRFGRWHGWLAATTTWWIRSQTLDVVGRDPGLSDVTLPRTDVALALGASFSVP
jgi:hypothetical protein